MGSILSEGTSNGDGTRRDGCGPDDRSHGSDPTHAGGRNHAPANPAPPTGPQTIIQLEAGNVVHLPEGTDTSHPVQVGNDLEFVQPDGSVIVIPNGAVAGLTIFVGTTEIPPDAVAALFQANNIAPAEGGQGGQGAHPNFDDGAHGGIGDGIGYGGLLGNTDLFFGGPGADERRHFNTAPRFVDAFGHDISTFTTLSVSEEGLSPNGIKDSAGFVDTTNERTQTGTFFVKDPDGDPLTFKIGQPNETLTSGGQPIHWTGVGSDTLVA